MRRTWIAVLAVAALPVLAAAQQVFVGGVDLITVDVVVLDKTGHPVPNLTPADFEITVNNKKDAVKALYYVDRAKAVVDMASPAATGVTASAPPAAAASGVRRPYAGRSILIGVNDISFRGLDAGPYIEDLTSWVKALDPADSVAVMTGSFRVAAPFSRDRAKTSEVLRDAAAGQMDPLHTGDVRLSMHEAKVIDENVPPSMELMLRMIDSMPAEVKTTWFRECTVPDELQMCFLRWRDEARNTATTVDDMRMRSAEAIRVYLETLKSAPPPRVLVLLADGAPFDDRVQFRSTISAAEEAGAQVFVITPDVNRASTAQDRDYTFSTKGSSDRLKPGDAKSPAQMRYEDNEYLKAGLDRLADETGGRVFRVSTSATPALGRIGDATSGFYRLGISVPPELNVTNSVPLKVVVKGSGRQVTAAARLRFPSVVESPEPVMVVGNARPAVAATAVPAAGPRVSAFPVEFAMAMQRADTPDQVRVVVSATVPDGARGPMKVAVGFVNDAGQMIKTAASDLTADGAAYRGAFAVNVPPGDYQVRVQATDGGGHDGWTDRPVAVRLRRFGGIAASDVIVSWAGADRTFHRMTDERVPAGAEYLVASVELYPVDAAMPPALALTVTAAEGQTVHTDEMQMAVEQGKTVARALIPVEVLKAGRYAVRVDAPGANADATSTAIVIAK